MERQEILDKLEQIWDTCQDRNIGSNEAELDFKESVADWIHGQLGEKSQSDSSLDKS